MLRIHGRDVFIDRPKCKIKLDEIEKAEVKVPIVRSQNAKVIVDAVTHMLSSSIAHGNEIVNVILSLSLKDGRVIEIKMNDDVLSKNSLDYHACVKRARELENNLMKAKNDWIAKEMDCLKK